MHLNRAPGVLLPPVRRSSKDGKAKSVQQVQLGLALALAVQWARSAVPTIIEAISQRRRHRLSGAKVSSSILAMRKHSEHTTPLSFWLWRYDLKSAEVQGSLSEAPSELLGQISSSKDHRPILPQAHTLGAQRTAWRSTLR